VTNGKAVLEDDMTSDVPLLILANKTDKCVFAGEDEIRQFFNLRALTTGKVCSVRSHRRKADLAAKSTSAAPYSLSVILICKLQKYNKSNKTRLMKLCSS